MNYTEEQIKEIFIKIMQDIEKDYFQEKDVYVKLFENEKPLWLDKIYDKVWFASVEVKGSENYPGGHAISIQINDENGEILNYIEGPGRPVPLKVVLVDEKYQLASLESD